MTYGNQVCNDAAAGIAGAHSRAALCVARVKAVFKTCREVVSVVYALTLHIDLTHCHEFSTWAPYVRKRAKNCIKLAV